MLDTSERSLTSARHVVISWLAASLSAVALSAQPTYQVQRIVDGDTVVLKELGSVRLIGVDTPETQDPRTPVQYYGEQAASFLRALLSGRVVRVEYDQQRVDRYHRTLAYLFLEDGTFVNREIVRQGLGHAYLTYPFRHMEDFRAAEAEAREGGRGFWAEAPEQAQAPATSRVWVNTASRVYHCPGTRYYGNTARGEYLDEATARQRGFRPAYGRECAPGAVAEPPSEKNQAPRAAISPLTPVGSAAAPKGSGATVKVWVNSSSRVYHCEGSRYFGATARGQYMSEQEAANNGYRPAGGRSCGSTDFTAHAPATAGSGAGRATALAAAPGAVSAPADVRVWVNTSSRVYHCPGARYYGATKNGVYLGQREAQAQGFRPAGGRACS